MRGTPNLATNSFTRTLATVVAFWLGFHPFRKIICCNQNESVPLFTLRKGSQHINGQSFHRSTNVVLAQGCFNLPHWTPPGRTQVTPLAVGPDILATLHLVKAFLDATQGLIHTEVASSGSTMKLLQHLWLKITGQHQLPNHLIPCWSFP